MDNQVATETKSLTSVGDLLTQSWQLFKSTASKILLLNLIGFGAYIILGILLLIVVSLTVGFGVFSSILGTLTSLPSVSTLSILGVSVVVLFIAALVVGMIVNIGTILIIGNHPQTVGLEEAIKRGLKLVLPNLGLSLLSGLIVFGGAFVFVIPALIFALFFIFAQFELNLNGVLGVRALKTSFSLVKAHFWEIFLRLLVLIGLYIGISVIISLLGQQSILIQILSFVVNTVLGWFASCYLITLYKQSRVGFVESSVQSISWIWIVSALGWVIAILLGIFLISYLPKIDSLLPTNSKEEDLFEREINPLEEDTPFETTFPLQNEKISI